MTGPEIIPDVLINLIVEYMYNVENVSLYSMTRHTSVLCYANVAEVVMFDDYPGVLYARSNVKYNVFASYCAEFYHSDQYFSMFNSWKEINAACLSDMFYITETSQKRKVRMDAHSKNVIKNYMGLTVRSKYTRYLHSQQYNQIIRLHKRNITELLKKII